MELAQVLLAGTVATACMGLFLYLVHWSGFANGDMVRVIGSWLTRRYENSLPIGWVIHFSAGAGFSVIYTKAWEMTGFAAPALGMPPAPCSVFSMLALSACCS
jgi:hypothetical protein